MPTVKDHSQPKTTETEITTLRNCPFNIRLIRSPSDTIFQIENDHKFYNVNFKKRNPIQSQSSFVRT